MNLLRDEFVLGFNFGNLHFSYVNFITIKLGLSRKVKGIKICLFFL